MVEIGENAFAGGNNLWTVTVPVGVTGIGASAFRDCPNLGAVMFMGDAPSSIGANVFHDTPGVTIYYRAGTEGWEDAFPGIAKRIWPEFTGSSVNGEGFSLDIAASDGQEIVVEYKADLSEQEWTWFGVYTSGSGNAVTVTDPDWAERNRRFYRIRIE